MENKTLYGREDGLLMNEDVGAWSPEKYRLLQLYAQLFTSGMKGKWGALAYIDLYSGAGQSRIKDSNQILLGSPLIALSVDKLFDHYVFCDTDRDRLSALRRRVSDLEPNAKVTFLEGDCNDPTFQIGAAIPTGSLSLCFVDPFDLGIRFQTMRKLAANRKIDFFCLLNSRADAGRNIHNYTKDENTKVDEFLGTSEWRVRWDAISGRRPNFGDFLCVEFDQQMQTLGYLPTPLNEMAPIKNGQGTVMYHLALFSKHSKAKDYWQQVLKYATSQRNLFD